MNQIVKPRTDDFREEDRFRQSVADLLNEMQDLMLLELMGGF